MMRPIRRFTGLIRRQEGFRKVLIHQLLLALLLTMLAFAFALIFNASMSYMGNKDDAAAAFVLENFWHTILFTQVKILLVYLGGFSLIGIGVAFVLQSGFYAIGRRPEGRGYRITALVLPIVFYLHWFAYSVLQWPTAYSRTLFEKGGVRRGIQVFLTDGPGPAYYSIVLLLVLLALGAVVFFALRRLLREGVLSRFSLRRRIIRKTPLMRRVWITAGLLLMLTLAFLFASEGPSVPLSKKKNLLILAADALRPDRLSLNGYRRATSPALDRYFSRGVSFERVFAEVPRTFPSWVTILSSQYSITHGIRHMFPPLAARKRAFPSLMQHLKKAGYRTGVVSDFAGDIFPRIDLGFEEVRAPKFNFDAMLTQGNLEIHTFLFPFLLNRIGRALFPVLREFAQLPDGELLADETIGMIRDFSKKGPFAITLFLSTTHFPYANRYPWYARFTDPDYQGSYKYYKQQVVMQGQKGLTDADRRQVNALYDGGVAAADAAAGRVLRFLEKRGLLENTVVVLTADHGENLYEPGMGMGHGEHLRGDWSTRVPFIVRDGDHPSSLKRIRDLASVVDIAPTLASLLRIPRDPKWEGRDLSYWVNGKGNRPPRTFAYSETGIWFSDKGDHFFQKQRIPYPDITRMSEIDFKNNREVVLKGGGYPGVIVTSKHRCWREGGYKLIYIPTRERILWELYDTKADPANRTNLIRRYPLIAARMKKRFINFCSAPGRDLYVNGFFVPDTP